MLYFEEPYIFRVFSRVLESNRVQAVTVAPDPSIGRTIPAEGFYLEKPAADDSSSGHGSTNKHLGHHREQLVRDPWFGVNWKKGKRMDGWERKNGEYRRSAYNTLQTVEGRTNTDKGQGIQRQTREEGHVPGEGHVIQDGLVISNVIKEGQVMSESQLMKDSQSSSHYSTDRSTLSNRHWNKVRHSSDNGHLNKVRHLSYDGHLNTVRHSSYDGHLNTVRQLLDDGHLNTVRHLLDDGHLNTVRHLSADGLLKKVKHLSDDRQSYWGEEQQRTNIFAPLG